MDTNANYATKVFKTNKALRDPKGKAYVNSIRIKHLFIIESDI